MRRAPKIEIERADSTYIASRGIRENDRLLGAYLVDQTAEIEAGGNAVPSLLDTAAQACRGLERIGEDLALDGAPDQLPA